ncbi:hypothetical protein CCAX7_52130 [Capsulimonas corticalis]|uniref:Uncharacterized protein n=1 Tax=Capsulimonas corticalis TaxID=2219043 RepID=A0A402CNX2_9BACT|nr:DinB family protein [Capsulimonas corticalis]BDI33162.1 hypothetical protein CCAX7_52130 [Capsulimonas corticalis]
MLETIASPAREALDGAKSVTLSSRDLLLATFSFIPDEKLNWSPSPTARTPIQIAAHCAAANAAFATLFQGKPWPLSLNPAEAFEQMRVVPAGINSRESVVKLLEDTVADVIASLEIAGPEALDTNLTTAFGEMPFRFWMTIPADHMSGHTRQIDYLQTIWGDLIDHR